MPVVKKWHYAEKSNFGGAQYYPIDKQDPSGSSKPPQVILSHLQVLHTSTQEYTPC